MSKNVEPQHFKHVYFLNKIIYWVSECRSDRVCVLYTKRGGDSVQVPGSPASFTNKYILP